jgi:hypothetical protein
VDVIVAGRELGRERERERERDRCNYILLGFCLDFVQKKPSIYNIVVLLVVLIVVV